MQKDKKLSQSNVTYELLIHFSKLDVSAGFHALSKEVLCTWLENRGHHDYVEGVIDGVEDVLLKEEVETAETSADRLERAPLALYSDDRSALDQVSVELTLEFGAKVSTAVFEIPTAAWEQCWEEAFTRWRSRLFTILPYEEIQKSEGSGIDVATLIEPETVPLFIDDRGGAFGTGQHRTTRCLLELLEDFSDVWKPESVHDVGCGTGILGIAAAKLGARRVEGTEIEQHLVDLANFNAGQNHVSLNVHLQANLHWQQEFDLVFANILVPVLHDLMPQLAASLKKNGRLLLAGFVAKEMQPLLRRADEFGLVEVECRDLGGWYGIVLVKKT